MRTAELREMWAAKIARHKAEDSQRQSRTHEEISRSMAIQEEMQRSLRAATPTDYGRWLAGYFAKGRQPTHFYDYMMPSRWFVATRDVDIKPLYGQFSINIIVPAGISLTGVTGHSAVYYMDGFVSRGFHDQPAIVPIYSDTTVEEAQ